MPRKVAHEDHRTLTVELPLSEFDALEQYCLQRQETKRQVIRTLIRKVIEKVADVWGSRTNWKTEGIFEEGNS